MSNEQQIEQDLREYLKQEPNLRGDDKLVYLKTIFEKNLAITKLTHVVDSHEFEHVVNDSKNNVAAQSLPLYISRKEVSGVRLNYIAVIEAFIGYLNKNNLLRKNVKFDYTQIK